MTQTSLFKGIVAALLFCGGVLTGIAGQSLAADTDSLTIATPVSNWETLAENPAFRTAVIAVINSCLVDNGVIYCD
ncbi:MAG: hypothetical protein AAGI24_09595 [Pseudomonadota bacterium]